MRAIKSDREKEAWTGEKKKILDICELSHT